MLACVLPFWATVLVHAAFGLCCGAAVKSYQGTLVPGTADAKHLEHPVLFFCVRFFFNTRISWMCLLLTFSCLPPDLFGAYRTRS